MRDITCKAVTAFFEQSDFRRDNTTVFTLNGVTKMHLHGNLIAVLDADGTVQICTGGWESQTTKERLNAILGRLGLDRVFTRNGVLHLNGSPWVESDKLTKIAA